MRIAEILQKYKNIEIEILLAHVLKKPKEFLYLHAEYKLSQNQVKKLKLAADRRLKGEPVAYILGYKDFMGLRFKVNKYVLIPRPETEVLVEKILNAELKIRNDRKRLSILDIGTGSGCIAISIDKSLQKSGLPATSYQLQATDISEQALKVARKNARNIFSKYSNTSEYWRKAKIRFVKSNLLEKVKGKFDIIVANLPYGWRGVKNRFSSVRDGLKFEPQLALYTEERGLKLISQLLQQIKKTYILNSKSYIFLEFDPRQKKELAALIKKIIPKARLKFYKDLGGLWRVAEIYIP
ncbi:MAG: peptide chain release factor N(5)-glutamine methyltransferase [Candidatus Doudnabacteria bacterium]|nr:peptide chain release factor N(5)-glutamine methyltransferase [Candidatus Doudnabacteria bacterium]